MSLWASTPLSFGQILESGFIRLKSYQSCKSIVSIPTMREQVMQTVKSIYWQEDGMWLGYLQDWPDYWTQGETFDDLLDHLKDLHQDLSAGLSKS
jgi:hypothetical protein